MDEAATKNKADEPLQIIFSKGVLADRGGAIHIVALSVMSGTRPKRSRSGDRSGPVELSLIIGIDGEVVAILVLILGVLVRAL